jgi:hypothetical protein
MKDGRMMIRKELVVAYFKESSKLLFGWTGKIMKTLSEDIRTCDTSNAEC